MKSNIVVIGDIFADKISHIKAFPKSGESTHGSNFIIKGGGTGANVAHGLAKLGVNTYMLGKLGADETGKFLKQDLKDSGVNVSGVYLDDNYPTGEVIILIDPDGERSIFVFSEDSAYEYLSKEETNIIKKIEPKYIYVTGVLLGLKETENTVINLLERYKNKVTIFFDPNLRFPPNAVPKNLIKSMRRVSDLSDYVITGRDEMQILGLEENGNHFIVTDGANGSYYLKNDEKLYETKARKMIVNDTTGAGDNYTAAFIYSIIKGSDIKESIYYATAAAGISVTKPGARSMPTVEEIELLLKKEER